MIQWDEKNGQIKGWRPVQEYDSETNEQSLAHESITFQPKPHIFADQLSYGTLLWDPRNRTAQARTGTRDSRSRSAQARKPEDERRTPSRT